MEKELFLGIDTSNYKTSVAIVSSSGEILCDIRRLLKVKEGEKGLRQSYALFQHIENLPEMIKEAFKAVPHERTAIKAVGFSEKPRPVQGSYMPVFRAGELSAVSAASALGVPLYAFSHQEGHLAAIKEYSPFKNCEEYLAYHLSGGTCELLKVCGDDIEIIGGSKDISFGQLLDRLGVLLGLQFPAGEELDRAACKESEDECTDISAGTDKKKDGRKNEKFRFLKPVKTEDLMFNLSGTETKLLRTAEAVRNSGEAPGKIKQEVNNLVKETFEIISDCLIRLTSEAVLATGISKVMFAGGVSQSRYVSGRITEHFSKTETAEITFGRQELSTDNAVGIALLAREKYRQNEGSN